MQGNKGSSVSRRIFRKARARWPARPRETVVLIAVAALGFGLSACGGSASPSVAGLGETTTGSSGSFHASNYIAIATAQFAHCIRTHGVPTFPEPVISATETA